MSNYLIMFCTVWVACSLVCIATGKSDSLRIAVGMTIAIWLVWIFQ